VSGSIRGPHEVVGAAQGLHIHLREARDSAGGHGSRTSRGLELPCEDSGVVEVRVSRLRADDEVTRASARVDIVEHESTVLVEGRGLTEAVALLTELEVALGSEDDGPGIPIDRPLAPCLAVTRCRHEHLVVVLPQADNPALSVYVDAIVGTGLVVHEVDPADLDHRRSADVVDLLPALRWS